MVYYKFHKVQPSIEFTRIVNEIYDNLKNIIVF